MKRTVLEVEVVDAEKRRLPSKHYVYIIHVHWSDGATHVIYRRYSKFFDFQVKLLDMFPEEAGTKNPSQRIIPFLPGKKLIGRSHIRKVAMERLEQIDQYCKALIRLPSKLSDSDLVLNFFETLPEDVTPLTKQDSRKKKSKGEEISEPIQLENYSAIADYKKVQSNEVSLESGDIVEVIEKNDSGWWFVSLDEEQGWVPATFLQKCDNDEPNEDFVSVDTNQEKYITTHSFEAQSGDELSLNIGVILDVVQKSLDGWWFAKYQDREGWVPATYLKKVYNQNDIEIKLPTEKIRTMMDVSQFKKGPKHEDQAAVKPHHTLQPLQLEDPNQLILNRSPMARHKPPPRRGTIKRTQGSVKEEKVEYYTIREFQATVKDGISFKKGQKAQILDKAPGGWWYVNIEGNEGWVPADCIEKQKPSTVQDRLTNPTLPLKPEDSKPLVKSKPKPLSSKPVLPKTQEIESKQTGNVTSELFQARAALKSVNSKAKTDTNASAPIVSDRPVKAVGLKPAKALVPSDKQAQSKPKPLQSPMKALDSKPAHAPVTLDKQAQSKPKPLQPPMKALDSKPAHAPVTLDKQAQSKPKPLQPPMKALDSKPAHAPVTLDKQAQSKPKPLRPPAPHLKLNTYVAISDYKTDEDGMLPLYEGMEVEVVEKDDAGWWLVKSKEGITAWTPSNYLERKT